MQSAPFLLIPCTVADRPRQESGRSPAESNSSRVGTSSWSGSDVCRKTKNALESVLFVEKNATLLFTGQRQREPPRIRRGRDDIGRDER